MKPKDERINGTRIKCYATSQGWDRFTVVYPDSPYNSTGRLVECVGMSGRSGAMMGRHLGKRVPFSSIPESLRRKVERDTEG